MNFRVIFLIVFLGSLSLVSGIGFEVNTPVIKSVLKQGESVVNPISILNSGNAQGFRIEVLSGVDFIDVDKTDFLIGLGEAEEININLNTGDLSAGVYSGVVLIYSENEVLKIPVIMEIESHKVLFDTSSELVLKSQDVRPGEYLEVTIQVFNLGSESGDVSLVYSIKDLGGEIIFEEVEELNVNSQAEINRAFLIPGNVGLGDHVFSVYAKDINSGEVGTSSFLFSVPDSLLKSPPMFENSPLYLASFVIIVLILGFLFINYYWNKRLLVNSKEWKEKLVDIKKIKFSDVGKKIRELEYQKRLLEKAYDKRYITKQSLVEGRGKINEILRRLKKRL